MRRRAIVVVVAMSAALPLGVAGAQQRTPEGQAPEVRGHTGGPVQARWIMEAPVQDAEGRALGNVLRVWIDPRNGRVQSLVVSAGGIAGTPITRRVVQWRDVKVGWTERRLHLVVDRGTLERAPEATESDMEEIPAASPAAGQDGTDRRD